MDSVSFFAHCVFYIYQYKSCQYPKIKNICEKAHNAHIEYAFSHQIHTCPQCHMDTKVVPAIRTNWICFYPSGHTFDVAFHKAIAFEYE